MRGSRIADEIIADMKREQYFKKRLGRKQCIVDKDKQCDKCNYKDICEDKDEQEVR